MKCFWQKLRECRIFVLSLLAVNVFNMVDGRQFVYAHQLNKQKEARLKEISELLDVPIGKLRPDHETLFESLRKTLGIKTEDPVKAAGLKRLQEALRRHEEQLAANPYLPQIEGVKNEHQIYRIEGMIQDLTQLTQPKADKALPEPSQRALLRNLHDGLEGPVLLPPVPEGLPTKAHAKHGEMQSRLDRLFDSARSIVAETQSGSMPGTIAQKVEQLRLHQPVQTKRAGRAPRFVDRPLPLRRVEKKARTLQVTPLDLEKAAARHPASASTPAQKVSKAGIEQEILDLAASLGNSPARIFRHVHDTVDFDPKWGAFKGPLGTLWEKSGSSWDQAWLLQELLQAAGVDARFEWGEIQISTEQLTNITGLDDPWRAGDLLTTAGVPIVLLIQGSQVIGVRMSHVWVKAHLDYVPNRGVTPGPGDTWIRMDPSFKRYDYAPGIQIHDDVPFSLGEYLLSGTDLSPRRTYEDALWSYLQANDIACTTLEQLKPAGRIIEEAFPFVPGTLRGEVTRVDGEASDLPAGFGQRIQLEVRTATGVSLVAWESDLPALTGQRLELAWQGATAGDQATLDSYGGVFETPPYLVDLKPVVKVGGVEQIAGSGIGSAEDVEIYVRLTPAGGPVDVLVHQGYAGEPTVVVTDFGHISQRLVSRYQEALMVAEGGGDAAEAEVATLQLIGATYFRNLGQDLEDLAGWNWHRLVRVMSEGISVQTGDVTTTAGGVPLTFTRGERAVDMAGLTLGLFDADGQGAHLKPTLELAGAQASFLEGQVFDEVVAEEGISAVAALTLALREGQSLTLVDGANVDAVLAAVELGDDVEAQVASAVGQGKVAWVPESEVEANLWQGTGYILEDPATGAAAYMLSGGFAAGADTGRALARGLRLLGNEPWLGPYAALFGFLFELLGITPGGGPNTTYGDPINLSNGNFWRTESDFLIMARGIPVQWSRTYNSQSTYSGPLGQGWTFTYGEHLIEQADGSVLYREADGTEHLFGSDGAGAYVAPPGKHLKLASEVSGFSLRTKDGLLLSFDLAGKLLSIGDPNGNTQTLSYDASGDLSSVTDAAGRPVLTVTVAAGKIVGVEDLTGRAVVYTYAGDDLVEVRDVAGETWVYAYDGSHNLISMRDPLGNTDTLTYDSFDRCIGHVDALGHSESFAYADERAVVTDRRGFSYVFEFDDRGRALRAVDPLGNVSQASWDEDNNRTMMINPRAGTTVQTFDGQGNMLSVTDPLNQTTSYVYEPEFSQVISVTDAALHTVTYDYDSTGNLTTSSQEVAGELIVETRSYDAFGQLLEAVDARGNATTYAWDAPTGALATVTDPLENTTTYTLDTLGRFVAIEDPLGNDVTAAYDERGNIEAVTDPFGTSMSLSYDAVGRAQTMTNALGSRTLSYDARGRVIAQTDPLGNTVAQEYDASGNVIATTDARGNRTAVTYDVLGRRLAVVDPEGQTWTFGYCNELGCSGGGCSASSGAGSFCDVRDPLGNQVLQDHDALGRVIRTTDPLGNVTSVEYDELGRQVRMTDALLRSTDYEYDELDRLKAVVEADGARTEYTHDAKGNQLTMRNAEGNSWTKTYDGLDRLASESDPLGNTTQFSFDDLGNLVRRLDAEGQEVLFDYDISRLTAIRQPGGATDSFSYDGLGRRSAMSNAEVALSYSYDALNRVVQVMNSTLSQTLDYEYDANRNLSKMIRAEGTVEYLYDNRNRLVEQRDPVTGTYRYRYDALGRRAALEYPNGLTTEYGYDDASRLLNIVTRNRQDEIIDGYSYTYDAYGNRVTMSDLRRGQLHSYEYDEINRLSRWQRGADRYEEYDYDLTGNRLELRDQAATTTYSYDVANRLLSQLRTDTAGGGTMSTQYGWSANGNMLSKTVGAAPTSFSYDALNRLETLSEPEVALSFGYDPNGVRVRVTEQGQEKRFLHDYIGRFENVVGEYDQANARTTYYTHGMNVDEPLAQLTENVTSYLHRDGLGSITALSYSMGEASGSATYSAFGSTEVQTGNGSRFGFTGREPARLELLYYRTRYYAPDTGRFITQDVFDGTSRRPSSIHKFTYAENDPTNNVDPSGMYISRIVAVAYLLAGLKGFKGFLAFMEPELLAIADVLVSNDLNMTAAVNVAFSFMGLYVIALASLIYINFKIFWQLFWMPRLPWPGFKNLKLEVGELLTATASLELEVAATLVLCLSGVAPAVTASHAMPIDFGWYQGFLLGCVLGISGVLHTIGGGR